jgi:hypothetical protein
LVSRPGPAPAADLEVLDPHRGVASSLIWLR